MLLSPFQPAGNNKSQAVAVGVASTPLAMPVLPNSQSCNQYWIANIGVNWVYYEQAAAATPQGAGVAPTAAIATSQAIPPNALVVVTAPPAAQFAFISAATGNTVQVTPGEGS